MSFERMIGTAKDRSLTVARAVGGLPGVSFASGIITRFGATAISAVILLVALFELHRTDWPRVITLLPHAPLFWLVFAVAWLNPAIADWAIYRRVWPMRLTTGVVLTLRKWVGNELLIGYAGEAYLFAWAKREGHQTGSALRAVKDVAILSAVVGNSVTLIAAATAAPFLGSVPLGIPSWALVAGLAMTSAPPLVAATFGRRLFALPVADLLKIAGIHAARAAGSVALTALLWHIALPGVAASTWLVFSAFKLLISRLPLVSNKDIVFAGVVAALFGSGGSVAALMTMMATLSMASHILTGVGISIGDVLSGAKGFRGRGTAAAQG